MKEKGKMCGALLRWYRRAGRVLPWRGEGMDPYRVWLSEIMLQQTTVAAVIPYYERFVDRWGCVESLAAASAQDVLGMWAGLGYYARARNLHDCAREVVRRGGFPSTEKELLSLPGIGPYTAAAIAAIGFGRHAVVVDGNVKRVLSRVFAIETVLEETDFYKPASALTPKRGAGVYAQALMDLGATVCRPRTPSCEVCPWEGFCEARARGVPEQFPRRRPKGAKPLRRGLVFWIQRSDGAVLVCERPPTGLLGGMLGFPTSSWAAGSFPGLESCAPIQASWRHLGMVRHTFTHFHLELEVYGARVRTRRLDGEWIKDFQILPSLMRKVAQCAQNKDKST